MKCGIVDVGSNTVQLSVYRYEGQEFKLLLNRWETVGLMGYVEDGALSEGGVRAACRVLEAFQSLLRDLEVDRLHVFATASLRNISNTEHVIEAVRKATGITIELLSGEEEARCSFRGALLGPCPDTGLMLDIGGGSTELVAYEGNAIVSARSLPMGALSLYKTYVDGLFPTSGEREMLTAHISAELERTGANAVRCGAIVGVGGTIRAVVKLCNTLAGADMDRHTVAADEICALLNALSDGGKRSLDLVLKAVPERVHTLMPGLMILDAVIRTTQAASLTVSESGVREGYLVSKVMAQSPGI